MGRGGRGKRFRKTVAGIPTARFRERLRGMTFHAGLVVIVVEISWMNRRMHIRMSGGVRGGTGNPSLLLDSGDVALYRSVSGDFQDAAGDTER
jgi:hypothetical protein